MLGQAFRDHGGLITTGVVFMAAMVALGLYMGAPPAEFEVITLCVITSFLFSFAFLFFVLIYAAGEAVARTPRESLAFSAWLQLLRRNFRERRSERLSPPKLAPGIAAMAALSLVNGVGIAKSQIPRLAGGFPWDPVFAHYDRLLHLGRYPHQWLDFIMNEPMALLVLDRIYMLWFPILFLVVGFCVFADTNQLRRRQFLWTYMLTWILLGAVAAIVFASAGPIYYGIFHPDIFDPYIRLVSKIHEAQALKPGAPDMAAMLLAMNRDSRVIDLNGISAMPGLHVGIAWLFVLYARTMGRWLYASMVIFFAAIMVGSVCLGWHYAIDGYAAVAGVTAIWFVIGRMVRRDVRNKPKKIPNFWHART